MVIVYFFLYPQEKVYKQLLYLISLLKVLLLVFNNPLISEMTQSLTLQNSVLYDFFLCQHLLFFLFFFFLVYQIQFLKGFLIIFLSFLQTILLRYIKFAFVIFINLYYFQVYNLKTDIKSRSKFLFYCCMYLLFLSLVCQDYT